MIRDIPHSIRQCVSGRRVRASLLAVVLCIVLAVSMVAVAPASAQESNETIPQCDAGPPIPGQDDGGPDALELMFVNDDSASMANTDNGETRMSLLKDSVTAFIEAGESDDEFGHVSFAPPTHQSDLTTDHQAVIDTVEALDETDSMGQDEAAGIELASDELQSGENATDGAQKVIVFVTDGSVSGDEQEARDEAADARDNGTTIFTVGIGDQVNEDFLIDVAGDADRYYQSDDGDLEEIYDSIRQDVAELSGGLTIDTRQLIQPGETHPYTVTNETTVDNQTMTEDVTSEASVNTSNESLLTADEQAAELTATSDPAASDGVVVTADHNGSSGCVNVIVAEPTVENLAILPPVWRYGTFLGDWTVFFFILATGAGIVGTRLATSFMGLSMMELVLVMGWFGGYISTGLAMVSVFMCLFIGLNLAANIDYQVQR